jgi:conjugative transfer signal peptidase TraF
MAAVALLTGAAAAADRSPAPALINESPSLPVGLYVRLAGATPIRGSVVAIPQPASARAYLDRLGMPAGVLLLKRVAGAGGDRVCAGPAMVVTPERQVAVRRTDRRGVELSAWNGCRVLGADELFLLGDTPSSFDSRYFGPVSRSEVTGVYREVLTW